ncbi:MAG: 30S ribosomal protein S17e [Candidatus Bathyarchaeia archaeon]
MGRVRTAAIKKLSKMIYQRYKDKFTSSFQENKRVLDELITVDSDKIRNQIAGYVTRLVKVAAIVHSPELEGEETPGDMT